MGDAYQIRDDEIDLMHEMDTNQRLKLKVTCLYCDYTMPENPEMHGVYYCPNCEESVLIELEPQLNASSVGRTQTGADSPPFVPDVNGPRQPKTQEGPHFVMPSRIKSGSNLPVSPSKEKEE